MSSDGARVPRLPARQAECGEDGSATAAIGDSKHYAPQPCCRAREPRTYADATPIT
jgi:hypothetical protein